MCDKKENGTNTKKTDAHQEWYRQVFHIEDDYLVGLFVNVSYDEWHNNEEKQKETNGYIVFIDEDNDIDFVDTRDQPEDNIGKEYTSFISKIFIAEAQPHSNLSFDEVRTFKRLLGAAMLDVMDYQFDAVDGLIQEAINYINQRNREKARQLFIQSAIIPALIASLVGIVLFCFDVKTYWWYGLVFSILGAFVSIWMKYGKEEMTGLSSKRLHYLESLSRIFIGLIFGVLGMYGVRCGIVLSDIDSRHSIFIYPLVAFIAAFSERFVPSLIEKIDNHK